MAFVILFVLGIFPRIILYTKLYLASSSNPSAVISTSIPSLTGYEPKSRFRCFRPGAGRQVLKLHSSLFVFSLRHVVLCFTTLRTHHQLRRSINMSKFQAALLNVSSCVPTVGYPSVPLLFVYLLRLANNYVPIRLVCLLRLTSTTKHLYASVRIPSSFIYYTYLLYLLYALMVEEESWK